MLQLGYFNLFFPLSFKNKRPIIKHNMKITMFKIILAVLLVPILSFSEDNIVDDAFDPFADYSDFIDSSTEETDVNFFKFGRMLSLGFLLGSRTFTGNIGSNYSTGTYFGASFTYYIHLRFGLHISYHTGTHTLSYDFPEQNASFNGSSTFTTTSLHGKYFINTQNLTKTVSKYNPFLIGGFSQINRDENKAQDPNLAARETVGSFDFGAGIEYLFNNNKSFVSLQATYYKADFPNEGKNVVLLTPNDNTVTTPLIPKGDPISLQISIGFNF